MKKVPILLAIVTVLSLTGCSFVEDKVESYVLQDSGILDDINYQKYQQYSEEGLLDTDGYFVDLVEEAVPILGTIHVTFASNNNLQIHYYTDAEHRQPLDTSGCYLEPGDTVYADAAVAEDVLSSTYHFSGFTVYEYGEEGKRKVSVSVQMEENENGYVLHIPADFSGSDLSVEPFGEYEQRVIKLNDYYTDDAGIPHNLNGTWTVNDKSYTTDVAEISPTDPYIVSYKYDSEKYFYVSSTPDSYYNDSVDGLIVFKQQEPDEETADYSVELHEYITVSLISDLNRKVSVNGGAQESLGVNEERQIPHLTYGNTITIRTDKEWNALENRSDLLLHDLCTINDSDYPDYKYEYNLLVPEKGGEFLFDPADYSYEHGLVLFKCFGQEVNGPQLLARGSRIYYQESKEATENGYWLPGENNYIEVGDEEATIAALLAIHFIPKTEVTLNLPQPKAGGSVTYRVDGTLVSGSTTVVYSGDKVTVKCNPWVGWIPDFSGEKSYTVGDNAVKLKDDETGEPFDLLQTAVDSMFSEDEKHKPKLTLTLDKSVGEMEVSLTASGCMRDSLKYSVSSPLDAINAHQALIKDEVIGTDEDIQVIIRKYAPLPGYAVRMDITMTDTEKNKTTETRYLDDLSIAIDPISIYEAGTHATASVVYKSVEIAISVVGIESYEPVAPGTGAKVTVRNQDTNAVLCENDLIEGSTKVVVTISPLPGYYITGKKVTNDVYSESMKFSDYQKKIDALLADHSAERYCQITLDESDSYAVYTYRLDGAEVQGTVNAKIGQKLELTYEITDPSYKLKEADGGFLFGLGASYTKATKEITITADMSGKTITKTDFEIKTTKGN